MPRLLSLWWGCMWVCVAPVPSQVGHAVDGLKFAGGAFHVMNRRAVKALNDEAHKHDVYTSTGGWIEHVLATVGDRSQHSCRQLQQGCVSHWHMAGRCIPLRPAAMHAIWLCSAGAQPGDGTAVPGRVQGAGV